MASRARVVIYLFRYDLRFLDNEALRWSSQNSDLLIPLYCLDPRHFTGTYHFGFPRTGPFRYKFLKESLTDLRGRLTERGSGLVVRTGEPEKVIPELLQQLGRDKHNFTLVWQEEVTKEETDVEKGLRECGVPTRSFWGSTLYHRADVPFRTEQIPDVYTEFRKGVEARSKVRPLIAMPERLPPLPGSVGEGPIPEADKLGVKEATVDKNSAFPFSGGETSALDRLKDYLWNTDQVATYKETRNGMIGPDYSTKFAPWLALGCISPRYIYSEIKRYESTRTANKSTYWVIFELIWRDYFKFVAAKYGDRLFHLSGLLGKHVEWKQDEKLFNAWKEGKTGVPYVDANMREMAATGFMSNRGRQNVASFLTKDLCLDWRLGAEWFEANLTDYDVCSNYGNWLYSAGLGNDPRENRKFNVIKQGLDYDPEGDYVRQWVPELASITGGEVHYPWALQSGALSRTCVKLGETYPLPIVTAPEWSKFYSKTKHSAGGSRGHGGGRGGGRDRGASAGGSRGQQRGIDFYFKGGSYPK